MWNKYYEVIEPLHYFERIGSAPSNTWVGASQAHDTIFEGKNASPGDQFHLLAGGDFILTEVGETAPVSFWKPPHLFEAHYHRKNSKELFQELEKEGLVREIPAPEHKVSYTNISHLPTFPQGTKTITRQESSPVFQTLTQSSDDLSALADDFCLRLLAYDFHEERRAIFKIADVNQNNRLAATIFEVQLCEDGKLFVLPSSNWFNCGEFISAMEDHPLVDKSRIYPGSFWATDVAILKDPELIKQVEIGLDSYLEKTNQKSVNFKP